MIVGDNTSILWKGLSLSLIIFVFISWSGTHNGDCVTLEKIWSALIWMAGELFKKHFIELLIN